MGSVFCRALFALLLSWFEVYAVAGAETETSEQLKKTKFEKEVSSSIPRLRSTIPRAPQGAPNIVLILLDDVGFADSSAFGGAAEMPALDALAKGGLRYNQFHTAGMCSPTRAALLAGRNHHRMGFGGFGGVDFPGYDGIWKESTASVAEVLRRNGYSTAAFGKWHNTPYREITPVGPFDRWPTGLGFDYFYGNMMGVSSQWEPPLWRNTWPVQQPKRPGQEYHFTSDITDDAIGWIRSQRSLAPDRPYFVYFATGAAHTPHHVPKAWVEKYRGRFAQGWDRLREDIFARQKKIGMVPRDTELTPRPAELPAWDSLSADEKRLFARQIEVYAAFLSHTDHEIGRLLDVVQSGPGSENTLILYIVGDNGAASDYGLTGMLGASHSVKEQLPHLDEMGGDHFFNSYAAPWGWVGNTPFQWAKKIASHFGGTRNPLVVSWPARLRGEEGKVRSHFAHVVDIAPTLYDAVGITPPEMVAGVQQLSLDGASFLDTFSRADAVSRHRVQYFEILGNRAIYQDGWVAAARHGLPWFPKPSKSYESDRWELYHVAKDFSQALNVAAQYPEKLEALKSLFDTEARRNNVYPLGADSMVFHQPDWMKGVREFSYYPGLPSVVLYSGAIPDFDKAHQIVADVWVRDESAEGAIIAAGGRLGGFVLYVKKGVPIYENTMSDRGSRTIISSQPLPMGKSQLKVHISRVEEGFLGRLSINDKAVGEISIPDLNNVDRFDNFDIGQDSASAVSESYRPPFRFTGDLESVRLYLK